MTKFDLNYKNFIENLEKEYFFLKPKTGYYNFNT